MKIYGTNGGSILYVEISIEELNKFMDWKIAQEYDIGFNEGFEMADKYKNAEEEKQ